MSDAHSVRCKDCLVRDTALCASLQDSELTKLSEIGRRKIVPKGAVVAWEGDENPLCANIVSGGLKLLKSTADGREQAVGLLFEGDFVGQPFCETGGLTAVAIAETDLCLYPRGQFERVLGNQPKLERALLERTMRSLNESRDRQLTLARKGARARIAGFLLDLSRASPLAEIELPMNRGDIADYLGLTIETVSRQFTELRGSGVIAAHRGSRSVTIIDRAALQLIAED
jgi:CRP/FNR family transcriptional regulator